MLCLEDPGLPAFATHNLDKYQTEIDDAGDYATRVAEGKRLFDSRNRTSNATFRAVRERLSQMCTGIRRCVYCEDSVADEVEHMKPKDLYPGDVFRWPNYVYACGPCNRRKNSNFAIIAEGTVEDVTRARGAPITPPTLGELAFINPRSEDPLDLMTMDLLGTFFILPREGLDTIQADRADYTIKILGLNRDLLLSARKNAFGGYRARLLEYRDKKNAGATAVELGRLRNDLLATPHPSVWEEMKRQARDIPVIGTIFDAVPEAWTW